MKITSDTKYQIEQAAKDIYLRAHDQADIEEKITELIKKLQLITA
jgi:hypothetical protein